MSGNNVRVWDRDFNLVGEVDQGWRVDEPNKIAVALASPLGQFIAQHGRNGCYLTVDQSGSDRWCGQIRSFSLQNPDREGFVVADFGDSEATRKTLEKLTRMKDFANQIVK
ncbi:hypothetical protein A6411_10765 [Prescottella equi]|uniref:hypothetical protein n=1 Tax=Rhodococcus hoagii TaxID=43767 RepID=UPI0009BCCFC0|nr:hypothetical protein [Prescottella equi]OQQ32279.1 hypothetical protein A6411_10765 [Prescottella equi]